MQTASLLVALGGDLGNTVPKHDCTASEIAILRAIHGEGSVIDIDPTGDVKRSNQEELSRLRANYGGAKDAENNSIVSQIFPGAAARMFDTIDELGLDESFFKPTRRAAATPVDTPKAKPEAEFKSAAKPKRGKKAAAETVDADETSDEAEVDEGANDEVEDLGVKTTDKPADNLFK